MSGIQITLFYNWITHELKRLTNAEDGEYYECDGINPTNNALIIKLVKYTVDSYFIEKTVELPFEELLN